MAVLALHPLVRGAVLLPLRRREAAVSERYPCFVCHHTEIPDGMRTCGQCIGSVRRALIEIEDMYAKLPIELAQHLGAARPPDAVGRGGSDGLPDPLVMLAPGSDGANQWREILRSDDDDPAPHARDELAGDPPSVVAVLESWERDWRHTLSQPPGEGVATVGDCVTYLTRHLDRTAQRDDTDFAEFVTDMRNLRHRLEAVLKLGAQRSDVPCLTCGTKTLEREAPRNGVTLEWRCAKCHRGYTQGEFWMAVRQQSETEAA